MSLIDRINERIGHQPKRGQRAAAPPGPQVEAGPDSPWVDIACRAGREWFRDHRGSPLHEYGQWASDVYVPAVLQGMGWDGVRGHRDLTEKERDALWAVRWGLRDAAQRPRPYSEHDDAA